MVVTISKKLIKNDDLVILSRKEYENLQKTVKKLRSEEKSIDAAIKVYKEEKKKGKLITIDSLADLD